MDYLCESAGKQFSKVSGNQIVGTFAAANIHLGSSGTYQITVGVEGAQKTCLIETSVWLNSRQRIFRYEK
jgi:hypothetical protein